MAECEHKNEDRAPGMSGTLAYLSVRREAQVVTNWQQILEGSAVYILTSPAKLRNDLRQLSRWPEDWTDDSQWWDGPWVVCWIPKLARKAQVRVQDIKLCQQTQLSKSEPTKRNSISGIFSRISETLGNVIGHIKAWFTG